MSGITIVGMWEQILPRKSDSLNTPIERVVCGTRNGIVPLSLEGDFIGIRSSRLGLGF